MAYCTLNFPSNENPQKKEESKSLANKRYANCRAKNRNGMSFRKKLDQIGNQGLQKNHASADKGRHGSHQANSNGGHGEAEGGGADSNSSTRGGGSTTAGARASSASGSDTLARAGGGSASGLGTSVLGAVTLETIALTSTVLQVLLGGLWDGGESVTGDSPVGSVLLGAGVGAASGVVVTVALGVGGLVKSLLQSIVVLQGLDTVIGDLDQTVVAALLRILVDETTGVDTGHLGGVKSLNLLELTGVGVATVLGKEQRKTVASEVLDLLVPARGGEGGGVAPGVVVESEEVGALVIGTAVHVLGHLETVGVDISGGVTDGNLTQVLGLQVGTQVTSDGLDIGGGLGGRTVVDNLVTGEESEGVGVTSELVDSSEDVLQVDVVVGDLGILTVQRVLGSVDIQNQVDTSLGEGIHALIVIGRVVDGVNTDGVQTEFLEVLDVTLATLGISNGVRPINNRLISVKFTELLRCSATLIT